MVGAGVKKYSLAFEKVFDQMLYNRLNHISTEPYLHLVSN